MAVIDWLKHFFSRRKQSTISPGAIEKAFDVEPAASRVMEDNINLWYDLYCGKPPWETCKAGAMGIPAAVGRELARQALSELALSVSGGRRGDYLNEQIPALKDSLQNALELGLCLGGVAFKPYPEGERILVDVTMATAFTPTAFDGAGRAVAGVFRETAKQRKQSYVRLEYHGFEQREDGTRVYVIRNKAYQGDGEGGAEVSLSEVDRWAGLQPELFIENLEKPLFSYFRNPVGNEIEPWSQVGVSVYSGATVDLIRQAEEQWGLLRWEYQSGERKIFADAPSVSAGQFFDRLFECGRFTSSGNLFEQFSPEFRDEALYRGFQRILQRIEFNVGLAYGVLSDPQLAQAQKTATEILSAKQRQYVTVKHIQTALQAALDDLLYAIDAQCTLNRLAPAGEYEASYSWGDGVLDDPDTRRQDMAMDASLVGQGLLNDYEFRMKWYKEDEGTAKAMLPKLSGLVGDGA